MKTSQQWWNEVKNDPVLMTDWLKDQYHGEVTAADRINLLRKTAKGVTGTDDAILNIIAEQERRHAGWIKDLLQSRGIEAEILEKEERYWDKVLPVDFESSSITQLAAIGAHAEGMRLERIRVIADDELAPWDIVSTFQRILIDEEWHERAFTQMSTETDLVAAKENHNAGLNALGLVI